jgi:peptide/nickel transport system ATP-binding protein
MLEVSNLTVRLQTQRGPAEAIRSVSFQLRRGDTLGLVGESGCGKSMTAMALMGLLPESATVTGSIQLDGKELVGQPDAVLRHLRGNRIGMIFQEPMTALNPVHTIGDQVAEPLRLHRGLSREAARTRSVALLERVGIPNAAGRADAYPHQFSGGQRQRITIAMALACEPDLLIADEPTSALDVTVRMQVLAILDELVTSRGLGLIFISHDLNLVASFCDRVLIMYAGRIVEECRAEELAAARHPYTRGLLASLPRIEARRERLAVLQRDPAWLDG